MLLHAIMQLNNMTSTQEVGTTFLDKKQITSLYIYLLSHNSISAYIVTRHVDRALLRGYYEHTMSKVANWETKRAKTTNKNTGRCDR